MLLDWITAALKRRIEKVATISAYMSEQCETPWTAIMGVLPQAAYEPALTLLTFGLDDVARGYLRPRGLRPVRKLRRRQRWYARPTIPELGEEIGKRLYGAEAVKGRHYGSIERVLWIADGAIQRALYHILVFDTVLDTWYNSIVALRKQGYCRTPHPPKAMGEGHNWIIHHPTFDWGAHPWTDQSYSYSGPPRRGILTAAFECRNTLSAPLPVTILVRVQLPNGSLGEIHHTGTIPPNTTAVVTLQRTVRIRYLANARPHSTPPQPGWTGIKPTGRLAYSFMPFHQS